MDFRFLALAVIVLALVSCKEQKPKIETAADESIVYFCKDITPENILKLYEALGVKQEGKIGLKVHFGEEGNQNFLNPELLRPLVEKVNPTFVETNVLYVGKRRYTDSHIALAKEHGFTFAPIDILDDEGETEIPAEGLKHYTKIKTGSHFNDYDNYIIYSHFKGHGSAGFGGAIKNVSMGLASPGGKMAMHATNFPTTADPEACVNCQRCVSQCPAQAITITENGPVIDTTKCIGCAKCIAECPLKIFKPDWREIEENVFLERLVEYAKVLSEAKPMVYINVMDNISKTCDCSAKAPAPFMEKVGAVASTDIVAIEMACHQLTAAKYGSDDAFKDVNGISGFGQVQYAHQLGMGNMKYVLVDVITGERISIEDAIK